MGPDSLVHIMDEYLTDGVLERLRLVPDSRMRIAPNIYNLIKSALSDFFRRETTPFGGYHRHIAAQ
jgi:hypothetical protein